MRYSASGLVLRQAVIGWDSAARVRLKSSGLIVTRFTLRLTAERLAQMRAARLSWMLAGVGGLAAVHEGELLVVDVLDDDRWIETIALPAQDR